MVSAALFFCVCALASTTILAQNLASPQWTREYLTKSTRDVLISVALDEQNGFAFVVGRTKGPRGMNVSFPGLVYDDTLPDTTFDNSKTFEDAIIAKVSISNGEVIWARRLLNSKDSRFSAAAISRDGSTVFAAGVIVNDYNNQPFIVHAFESHTGEEKGSPFISKTKGSHFVTSIVAHDDGLYVCGRSSAKNGAPVVPSDASVGGIMIASISKSGQSLWLKQGGQDLATDYCSGLSLSADGGMLFVVGTSHRESSSKVKMGLTTAYALSPQDGSINWVKKLDTVIESELRSSGVIAEGDAVYVSTSFWSESNNGRKMYMHKLSKLRGTLLWSKETCCHSIRNREPEIEDFDEKGSAAPISGLTVGADRYLYYLGHYQRRSGLVPDRHATVVVRIGEYGDQDSERDISLPVETFKIIPSEPKRAVISSTSRSIFILSNDMFISSSDIDVSLPKLDFVKFSESEVKRARRDIGLYYMSVEMQLYVSSVPVGSVFDLVAERLRIAHNQIKLSSNQMEDKLSQLSEAKLIVRVYGKSLSDMYEELERDILKILVGTGQSDKNEIEKHFSLAPNSVHLVEGSLNRVEEGIASSNVGEGNLAAIDDSGNSKPAGQRDGGFNWSVFGIAAGAFAGLVLVVGGVVAFLRSRNDLEESFVSSSLHGRPAESNGEIVYYSGYSG